MDINEDLFCLTIIGKRNGKYIVDGMTYDRGNGQFAEINFECLLTKDFKLFAIREIEVYKDKKSIVWSNSDIARKSKPLQEALITYLEHFKDSIITNNWNENNMKMTIKECNEKGIKY